MESSLSDRGMNDCKNMGLRAIGYQNGSYHIIDRIFASGGLHNVIIQIMQTFA